ncbi:MAG: GIY-YIG nuclease family protein [Chitinophagaceae bacterium]|nr:MAG: GIY-YIG nuclease family protein [Chitinophagaceae bacterium]
MIIVYAVKSLSRNYIYVGMTNDVSRRLVEHNNGENKSTKAYKPFILIYTEGFPDRTSGRIKERYLKSGVGKEFLRTLS